MPHHVTLRSLARREIKNKDIAQILDCTEGHVEDLMSGFVAATAREIAILRLCANAPKRTIGAILSDLNSGSEWRTIPGFECYEVSGGGMVRRAAGGHGSQAGRVLKARKSASGYPMVNLSAAGRAKTMMIHVLVCTAFHGPKPTDQHLVCHRNDIPSDNQPGNLYWGTPAENAVDRSRNASRRFDTWLTRARRNPDKVPKSVMRKITQYHMDRRLRGDGEAK